tara:strand:+ start:633 stop:1124 length:492 start_codon:yes stop_codon:yes gene_type:complete
MSTLKVTNLQKLDGTSFPIGKFGQVIQGSASTAVNVTSSSFTDTGLTATITPTATTSKVMIHVTQMLSSDRDNEDCWSRLRLVRDGSGLSGLEWSKLEWDEAGGVGAVKAGGLTTFCYLDSPSTLNAVVYKLQGSAGASGNNSTARFQMGNESSFIQLIEVLA